MQTTKGLSERVESWLARIPGIRTYRDREHRRETDKRVREGLAARLDEARAHLSRVTMDVSNKGLMEPLDELGRLSSHLQQLADTVRYASYGYSGIFDLDKIREEQLDRLYEFDLYLMDDVDAIYGEVVELKADLPQELWGERIREVEERLDALQQRYSRRNDFMARVG
ncbi:MAG: hypothetical protein ACUVXD_15170 [Thermodesulfobacteriota bacterium]